MDSMVVLAADNLANEMNFGMKHSPGAGSLARHTDLLPIYKKVLPLCYDCPLMILNKSSGFNSQQ